MRAIDWAQHSNGSLIRFFRDASDFPSRGHRVDRIVEEVAAKKAELEAALGIPLETAKAPITVIGSRWHIEFVPSRHLWPAWLVVALAFDLEAPEIPMNVGDGVVYMPPGCKARKFFLA